MLDPYWTGLGFESEVVQSHFRGGVCKLCGRTFAKETEIAIFRGRKWVHISCASTVVGDEEMIQDAKKPHADPMVAAMFARQLPIVEARLALYLAGNGKDAVAP